MKRFFFVTLLCLVPLCSARALSTVEVNGISLTYPSGGEEIVARMAAEVPSMLRFLAAKGLEVTTPVHVFLDGELDFPAVKVTMIPHRGIRIPLRAPGVFEEGYREADPWTYFLLKGLCLQGIYAERSGIPAAAHTLMGEVISPNLVLPPWMEDGLCAVLIDLYRGYTRQDSYAAAVFRASKIPDTARLSNHPDSWPGYEAYRIFGRPFMQWLHARYGWEKLREFLFIRGRGLIPIEIDLKARTVFGQTWPALWREFGDARSHPGVVDKGTVISGFWPEPLTYWNVYGIYPGIEQARFRGRYGFVDQDNTLWLSEYTREGVSQIVGFSRGVRLPRDIDALWDPAPGGLAVTRKGHVPWLVRLPLEGDPFLELTRARLPEEGLIAGPQGAIQLSGPVMDARGRIAVAAHIDGNWDIWVHDGAGWTRVTASPAVEADPWWEGDTLVFTSDSSGAFQIHASDMTRITHHEHAAVLPRAGQCLSLTDSGWGPRDYAAAGAPAYPSLPGNASPPQAPPLPPSRAYSPLQSVWPDYLVPDLYLGTSDVQLGVSTRGQDITGDYTTDAGVRHSADLGYTSWRLGAGLRDFALLATRYPVSYSTWLASPPLIALLPPWERARYSGSYARGFERLTEESRHEYTLSWRPFREDSDWLELSLHALDYEPLELYGDDETEIWGAVGLSRTWGNVHSWTTLEAFSGGRTSAYGGARLLFGRDIFTVVHVQAGKTWEGYAPAHGSFRIGGDVGEGYFTRRPSRLFPVRGFASNVLEAGQALTGGLEIYWPLANLQTGYKTLPLFLHRLRLGTFADAGACTDHLSKDDLIIGGGIELITSLEIAWGNLSSFRLGVAWPIRQPDYMDEEGPRIIIQLGRPL